MMDLDQIKKANANPKEFYRSRLSDYEAAQIDNEKRNNERKTRARPE
jgi:hypothetical protein